MSCSQYYFLPFIFHSSLNLDNAIIIYIYVCVCVYMYVCICVCVYMCVYILGTKQQSQSHTQCLLLKQDQIVSTPWGLSVTPSLLPPLPPFPPSSDCWVWQRWNRWPSSQWKLELRDSLGRRIHCRRWCDRFLCFLSKIDKYPQTRALRGDRWVVLWLHMS